MNNVNLKRFPLSPGVYLFKDYKNRVIYVGRAAYLRKRITSYFNKTLDSKTSEMVSKTKKIEFIKTDKLIDAVILEANLIKKHWPKYNIRDKDSRSFIYIVIPKKEWAYPLIVRGQQLDKYRPAEAYIFGPFRSYSLAKNLLLLLRKILPWSSCKLNQKRPCFYNQIGLCPGKCTGTISEKDYQKLIKNLILIFQGKKDRVRQIFKKGNSEKLEILKRIDDSILITGAGVDESKTIGRIEGYDISHFAGKETVGAMVVWQNGGFDKTQHRLFKIRANKPNNDLAALEEMINRRFKHAEWEYPGLIMVDGGRTQVKIVERVLAKHKLNIPVVGITKPPRLSMLQHGFFSTPPSVIPAKAGIQKTRSATDARLDPRLRGDDKHSNKLIFGKIQKPLKDLISLSFPQLLKVRNEAHRFANSLRKKLLKKQIKS